jgi:hypothetical protein
MFLRILARVLPLQSSHEASVSVSLASVNPCVVGRIAMAIVVFVLAASVTSSGGTSVLATLICLSAPHLLFYAAEGLFSDQMTV